jgi:hypothetical protein
MDRIDTKQVIGMVFDKRPSLILKKELDKIQGVILDKKNNILDSFEIPIVLNMNSINSDDIGNASRVINQNKINPYNTKVIICGKQIIFRSFYSYYRNKKELTKGIDKEIKSKISFPNEKYRYDYLYKKVPEGFFINVGALKEEHVEELLEFLTKLKIKPSVFTVEPILLHSYVVQQGLMNNLSIFFLSGSIHLLTYHNELLMNYQKITVDVMTSPYEVSSYIDRAVRDTGIEDPEIYFYKHMEYLNENELTFLEELEMEFIKPRQVFILNDDPLLTSI